MEKEPLAVDLVFEKERLEEAGKEKEPMTKLLDNEVADKLDEKKEESDSNGSDSNLNASGDNLSKESMNTAFVTRILADQDFTAISDIDVKQDELPFLYNITSLSKLEKALEEIRSNLLLVSCNRVNTGLYINPNVMNIVNGNSKNIFIGLDILDSKLSEIKKLVNLERLQDFKLNEELEFNLLNEPFLNKLKENFFVLRSYFPSNNNNYFYSLPTENKIISTDNFPGNRILLLTGKDYNETINNLDNLNDFINDKIGSLFLYAKIDKSAIKIDSIEYLDSQQLENLVNKTLVKINEINSIIKQYKLFVSELNVLFDLINELEVEEKEKKIAKNYYEQKMRYISISLFVSLKAIVSYLGSLYIFIKDHEDLKNNEEK